jgi:HEAT repeat protein
MKRVFISYCHENGDFSDALRRRLEEAGIPTWQDTDLYGGQQWRAEIDLAIREALAVIVVVSPEAMQSGYVAYEWAFALGAGVNVIPVLLRAGSEPLHPALQARQCLDFSSRLARPWELLFRAVQGTGAPARNTTIHIPPGAPPVLEQAVRSLDSMDESQRNAGLDSLETMDHEAVVEVLAGAVTHPIREVRFRAGQMLLRRGDRRALPAVIEELALRHRWSSDTHTFTKLGRDALPDLVAALHHEDSCVRGVIAREVVGAMRDPATIPDLLRLLDDEDSWVRQCAIRAASQFRDSAMLPAFQKAFRRKDGAETEALEAAAFLPGSEDLLIEGLDHKDSSVRQKAAQLLGKSATRAALAPLCRAARDRETSVRAEVVSALGSFPEPEAIESLGQALDDESSFVRKAARDALVKIGGPAVVACALAALRNPERIYRDEPALLVGELGEVSLVPALLEALADRDADVEVRVGIIESLAKLGRPGSPAVSALIGLLSDSSPRVVREAAWALGRIADPASVGPLRELLDTADEDLQKRVAAALGQIGTPEVRRLLVRRERQQHAGA